MPHQPVSEQLNTLREQAQQGDAGAQEALGRELVSGASLNSETFVEGLDWTRRAAEQGRLSATVLLGHLHCQYPTLPNAAATAAGAYETAARAGDPEALIRMADLYLFGYGVARDDARAFSILNQLCAASFPNVLCQTAYLYSRGIGCAADESAASTLWLRAAAQGETQAFAVLAQRYRCGLGVPRRADIALAWLLLAQRRKFPGASEAADGMASELDDAQRAGAKALSDRLINNIRQLGQATAQLATDERDPAFPARFTAAVADNFGQLGEPALALSADVRGSDAAARPQLALHPRSLSWRPRVFILENFMDAEERACLLGAAAPLLVKTADQRAAGAQAEIDEFDGACAVFAPHLTTPVVRAIQRRWASVLHLDTQHFEPASVLRYEAGHEYTPHVDYFDSARMWAHRQTGDLGGQRLITGLVCLLAASAGGATCYPAANLTVMAQPGDAVFHYNTNPEGLADTRSLHEGQPVTAGEKWLLRTAVRERNLYDELETVL